MKYFYLSAILIILTIASCNKKPAETSTVASTLQTGKWRLSSGTLSMRLANGNSTSLNYTSQIVPSCHTDDYIQFHSGLSGAVHANITKCSPADPDSVSFGWQLSNNNTNLNIYNSQNFYYSVLESVQSYHFDTVSQSPLVLDSISYSGGSVIDSIYPVIFTEISAPTTGPNNLVDIYNATITNFSQSAFTLNFSVYGSYPDTTNHRNWSPVIRADTFHYSLTYTNF